MDIKKFFVVGSGAMGRGIAQQAATCGFDVVLNDISAAQLESAKKTIEKSLAKAVEKGKMEASVKDQIVARIKYSENYDEVPTSDVIVEAAVENLEIKQKIFEKISEVAREDAILASNTSSISITAIAKVVKNPERFIGLHFFNPVPVMKLLEIVVGLQTSEEVIEISKKLGEDLKKVCIVVKDSAGFVVNRLLVPMINEAIFCLDEGVASAEDIDNGMKFGCNHPMGPLALADMIGNDVCLAIMDVLYHETGDSKYRACQLLRKMVRANHLGMKTGKGFYDYSK